MHAGLHVDLHVDPAKDLAPAADQLKHPSSVCCVAVCEGIAMASERMQGSVVHLSASLNLQLDYREVANVVNPLH